MYSILIIDDEPIVKIALRSILPWEEHGFSICGTASNGLEAMPLIEKHQPDLWIYGHTHECDDQAKGFQWMNEISANECYVSFVRKGEEAEELLLVVANFSGVPREITTGVPYEGKYKEILNTDAVQYGGTGVVNDRVKRAEDVEWDDKKQSVTVKMAPLSLSILQFIPYTEAELEKVIEKRIRKNTPIRKTAGKTTKRKQEK